MCNRSELLDKLANEMPKEFWDNLIVRKPWEKPLSPIRIEDII